MTPSNARRDHLIDKLRSEGHRITPQRLAIIEILTTSDAHPTVEQVYAAVREVFPTTSLATVYKTVAIVKEMGELLELEFGQGSNRYDGKRPYPHPHVICIKCSRIMDTEAVEMDAITRRIIQETGFRIINHRLDFFGLCPACQKKDPP